MSGRHFAPDEQQPDSFAWNEANREAAAAFVAKYPDGRQASAVIPLLDLAQRQEGWVSLAAIEHVADMLDMAPIRVQEVASFYFMFNLAPIGKYHVQVCGTTPCWLRGVDQVYAALRDECGIGNGQTSEDGLFTVTEVECLGACVNAPMVQINDDYYEDLDKDNFAAVLRALKNGEAPTTNSQTGRQSSEPEGGATTLTDCDFDEIIALNRKRPIGGVDEADEEQAAEESGHGVLEKAVPEVPADEEKVGEAGAPAGNVSGATPSTAGGADDGEADSANAAGEDGVPSLEDPDRPPQLMAPRGGQADDLKRISGVGPKIEEILNNLGIFHFDQVAAWTTEQVAWVNGYLRFKGRIDREDWLNQARTLASEGDT